MRLERLVRDNIRLPKERLDLVRLEHFKRRQRWRRCVVMRNLKVVNSTFMQVTLAQHGKSILRRPAWNALIASSTTAYSIHYNTWLSLGRIEAGQGVQQEFRCVSGWNLTSLVGPELLRKSTPPRTPVQQNI